MKHKTITAKDMMEIEDIKEDPVKLIFNQIKKYSFASREMLLKNCHLTPGVLDNILRQALTNGEITGTRKLVKFKGEKRYVSVRGYVLGDKNERRRGRS